MTNISAMNNFTCITPSGAAQTRFGAKPNYSEGLYDLTHQFYAWMVPNGS